jgi:hypothetical protein
MTVPEPLPEEDQNERPICFSRRDFLFRLFLYWFAPLASAPGFTVNAETQTSRQLVPLVPRPLWIHSHVRREVARHDDFMYEA